MNSQSSGWTRALNFFSPPSFADAEQNERARVFHYTAWIVMLIATFFIVAAAIQQPDIHSRAASSVITVNLLCLSLLALNRLGWTRMASGVLLAGLIVRIVLSALSAGGITSPGVGAFLTFVLMAELLLGHAAGWATAGVCAAAGLGLVVAERHGALPPQTTVYSGIVRWTLNCIYLGLVIFLSRMASQSIRMVLRRAETELENRRKAEQRLDRAAKAGLIGTWDQDPQTGTFYGDARAFGLLGLPVPADHALPVVDWKDLLHPQDLPSALTALESLHAGSRHVEFSYRITCPDGSERYMEAAAESLLDEQRRLTRIVGMIRDVTEIRAGEEQRKKLLYDYRERIKELTALKNTSTLLLDESLDVPAILQGLADLLPPAFQYPDVTRARVRCGQETRATPGFRETPWLLSQSFAINDGEDGAIEVVYLAERPPDAEGPFFREERQLLEALSKMLQTALERRRARQGLLVAEQKYRAMVENIGDGIALVDASGVVTFDSDTTGNVLGYTGHGFEGVSMLKVIHPADLPAMQAHIRRAMEAPDSLILILPLRYQHRSGKWVWVEGSIKNRLGDPAVSSLIISYRDVTPRITAQAALAESEVRYRRIVETSEEGILILDKDGVMTFVNPKLCAVTGYSPQELTGQRTRLLLFPEDIPNMAQRLERVADTGAVVQYDANFKHRNGSVVPVFVTSSALRDEKGAVLGATCMITDMTVRKQLQAELLQSQKIDAMGRLSGGVAHDFNNLLTAILGFAELAKLELPASAPARADLAEIAATAMRAASLTRQLLAFSRKQALQPVTLDVNNVVREMQRMLARIIGEDMALEARLADGPLYCWVDRGQIEQVLLNLVVNARDAMPKGGRVTVSTAPLCLEAPDAAALQVAAGDYLKLVVADTGIGMSADTLRQIFEPFFTTKPKGQGTGLGLSTVHGIVKQSGGCVQVKSALGAGTTFEVLLPRTGASEDAKLSAAPELPESSGAETILLTDDDAAIRTTCRRLLSAAGYRVLEADSGRTALAALASEPSDIHLLLTDLVMTDMSGFDLAKEAHRRCPSLRVLCISGYLDRERPEDTPGLTLNFLQKPFSAEELFEKVRDVLGSPIPG